MKQTPMHDGFNADVLARIPADATRVIEVGCGSGALARAFRQAHPDCDYIGIEIDPEYAEVARASCTGVVVGNIEHMDAREFDTLFPASCWIFSDVLEHLYDPWEVLRRIRGALEPGASLIACIPNAQHWSVQARLNHGAFRYEDFGLMDRTHIRWFTRTTIVELFQSTGYQVQDLHGRVFEEPDRERIMAGVKALAAAIGIDAAEAAFNATPLQWVVRSVVPARTVR